MLRVLNLAEIKIRVHSQDLDMEINNTLRILYAGCSHPIMCVYVGMHASVCMNVDANAQ